MPEPVASPSLPDRLRDRVNDRLMRHAPGPRLDIRPDRPIVSFTFDDVPATALSNGARILEAHGVRGTFYIAGGLVGREAPPRQIDRDGCRQLLSAGHEIASHTFGHEKVRHLARRELAEDLSRNTAFLDGIDGSATTRRNFAYPYNAGSFAARDLFSCTFRTCRAGGDRINRGRVNPAFLYGMEIRQPESEVAALVRHLDEVVREPGWLIFFTHDIAEDPTPYGCTPGAFEHLVAATLARGCTVLTVASALDAMGHRA